MPNVPVAATVNNAEGSNTKGNAAHYSAMSNEIY